MEGWAHAQLVGCLTHKQEDLIWDPQHGDRELKVTRCSCIPSTGEVETQRFPHLSGWRAKW